MTTFKGLGVLCEIKVTSRMRVVFIAYFTVKDWDHYLLCFLNVFPH